jgi:aromatic ring-opening dioxygenase catalytic subunit (LigB family)
VSFSLFERRVELVADLSFNCSFYGFPDHYYKEKYPNVGSKEVSQKVLDSLTQAGIKAEGVKRGLDHGVWASFKCGTSYLTSLSSNSLYIIGGH